MAWIRTIGESEACGRLAAIYRAAARRAGKVSGIVRVMSLDPGVAHASMRLYEETTVRSDSPLPRWFRELIAVTVSRLNACHY
ncbi:MAG: peroxidase [Acidobacteria bacterium]|nr:MAG: peroxidase [Acidobacteriota bacterium]